MLVGAVFAQPVVVNSTLPDALFGATYAGNLMVGGNPMPTSVTLSGLPSGLTATHNASGSVAITGIPTQHGVFSLELAATNGSGTVTRNLSLTVTRYSTLATGVSIGEAHTCAVVNAGVYCWGTNSNGELGNNSTLDSQLPVATIAASSNATAVGAGRNHSCAVVDGGVRCWGDNYHGQLGDNSTISSLVPVQAIAPGSGVATVTGGDGHSCALVAGGVQCWGVGGRLGINSSDPSATPVQAIAAGSLVTGLSAGSSHTCAVVNGGVQCWGFNNAGQLGDGSNTNRLLPVQVLPPGSLVTAVASGQSHTCAVVNGGVQCWGTNGDGQLGNSSTTSSLAPVQVIATGSLVTSIAAGVRHSCAVIDGGVRCWGANSVGQLGNNTTDGSLVPVEAMPAGSSVNGVSVGPQVTCALVRGAVRCWGGNVSGQLGNVIAATQSLLPAQAFAAGSNVTSAAAGTVHSCAVISGGVQCWGRNSVGQLGNNSKTSSALPVQAIAVGSGATAVASGERHTCAVVAGGLQCWGNNGFGELGISGIASSLVPVQTIAAGSVVTAVAASYGWSCAVVAGGVRCWGRNELGQLGNNSIVDSRVPVQTIAANSGATAIAAGEGHACAVVAGSVRCWGSNASGQLGNNSVARSLVPVQTIATDVTALAASSGHTCAVVSGGLQCWGGNTNGALGNGSVVTSLVPVQVINANSNATAVALGYPFSCAVVDGGVRCWGKNDYGQLGINSSTAQSLFPVQAISSGAGAVAIAAGGHSVCAVVNGGLQCWGDNAFGQLADPWTAPYRHVYAAIPYTTVLVALSVSANGEGSGDIASTPSGINCGAFCSASFAIGTQITLTATPSVGSTFIGWAGSGCSGAGVCVVTLNLASTVTATFDRSSYAINTNVTPTAGGMLVCTPNPVVHGGDIMCVATANSAYTFTEWTGDCSGYGLCSPNNVTSPKSITANFTLNSYSISASAVPLVGGSVSCAPNPVDHGSSATCSAVPSAGHTFASWSGDCAGSGTCTLSNVSLAKMVTANFNADQSITGFNPVSPVILGAPPANLIATPVGPGSAIVFATTSEAGICTVSGNQVSFVGIGSCNLTANRAGATGFNAAPQVSSSIAIGKATPTLAVSGHGSSSAGASVSLTATLLVAFSATGSVAFTADGSAVAGCGAQPLAHNAASCSTSALAVGAHSIAAVYSGDGKNQGATAPAVTHTVNVAAPPFAFAPQVPASRAFVAGTTFALSPAATAGPSSSPVTYSASPSIVCSIAGGAISMNGLGDCLITASQAGDASNASAAPQLRTVALIATLDIFQSATGATAYRANADGLLIIRYLSGIRGAELIEGGIAPDGTRIDPVVIKEYLDTIRSKLDVDGNGIVDSATDGVMILRYMFGVRGSALTVGALATVPPPTRTLPSDIEAFLRALMP